MKKEIKRQIRYGVFETNSSSTHSLTICSAEEYEKWKKGEVLFNNKQYCGYLDLKTFPTMQEVINYFKNKSYTLNIINKDFLKEEGIISYNDYFNDWELETYMKEYTTKKGENIVAFGKFGRR